jgi:toxin-antitoxin system PIN domain toxin
MILPDVNVLIYAFRRDSARHKELSRVAASRRRWSQRLRRVAAAAGERAPHLDAPEDLSSAVHVAETLAFCEALLEPAHSTLIQPGERHWSIFADLCESSKASGNLVQDAWFAALAIEHGCEWISTDADYARFRGLRWQRPFE